MSYIFFINMNYLVFNVLKYKTVSAAATVMAIKSAIGAANNMPSMPKNMGIMIISGMKQIISRIIDDIIACTGFPTAWKKIEVIFIVHVNVTSDRKIRKVFSANIQ